MLKKKFYFIFYLAAIIFILFFTLNGNKIYTIKEKDIENNNKLSLEKENLNIKMVTHARFERATP